MGTTSLKCWSRRLTTLAFLAILTVVQGQSNGPIRLWRNGHSSSAYTFGRVQVYFNSQWGNICDDGNLRLKEAHVICQQLGYSGASSFSRASTDSYGTDTSPTVLSGVDCSTSSYLVILQCSYNSTHFLSSCTNSFDVSVNCYSTRIWNSPYNGQIRLTGGTTVNQGLVEVYCNGQWGTVCDDGFGQAEADTVCRQLGYDRANDYDHLSIRGTSSQPIWLDEVSCSSARPCIGDCVSQCSVSHDCTHSEDITITCYSPARYTATTSSTCTMRTAAPLSVGAVVGGTIAAIFLVTVFIFILIACIVKKPKAVLKFLRTGHLEAAHPPQTPGATTSHRAEYPRQQPSEFAFTLPQRPEEAAAAAADFPVSLARAVTTAESTASPLTDTSITAAPPPAYGLADNYATYNKEQSDLPPPSYSETLSSLSLPTSPAIVSLQSSSADPPPYSPQT